MQIQFFCDLDLQHTSDLILLNMTFHPMQSYSAPDDLLCFCLCSCLFPWQAQSAKTPTLLPCPYMYSNLDLELVFIPQGSLPLVI